MNFGESSGGSSSSGRENGAASPDDRPHKKARFPWQIKGKHHLKNQTKLLTESPTVAPEELETDASPSEPVIPPSVLSDDFPFGNSSKYSGNVMKPRPIDFEAMRSLLIPEGISPLTGLPTIVKADMPFEEFMAVTESMLREANIGPFSYKQKQESGGIFTKEARRLRRAEDRCISQWQYTQTQRSCFQNSLNKALEVWKDVPGSAQERFLTHIDDLPPKIVENQAILMAISAYGLQFPLARSIPSQEFAMSWADETPMDHDDSDSDYSICSEDSELANLRDSSSWTSDEDVTDQNRSATGDAEYFESPRREEPINDDHSTTGDEEIINIAVTEAIQRKGLMAADFG